MGCIGNKAWSYVDYSDKICSIGNTPFVIGS